MTWTSNELLAVNDVGKIWQGRIGEIVALRHVTFSVEAGSFVCLLGPSGCGKSTLLEIMAGLEKPTSGNVLMKGEAVSDASPERGMVFQSHSLFPWRTVRENVEFGLEMTKVGRSERRQVSNELLSLVGLSGFADSLPRELSGGMQQRVAVARALATSPPVLLMDEPFGALDAQTREELQREISRIWTATKTTIVFVTHSVQEAVILADQVLVMSARPGRISERIENHLARPRDPTAPEFGAKMRTVYAALNAARGG